MTDLYNCKHDGDQYRITKFDSEFNPLSSYLTTREECDCPAGHRPVCRHRTMLHDFLEHDHIDDNFFYNYAGGAGYFLRGPADMVVIEEPAEAMVEIGPVTENEWADHLDASAAAAYDQGLQPTSPSPPQPVTTIRRRV